MHLLYMQAIFDYFFFFPVKTEYVGSEKISKLGLGYL
jgi:hypothetical protein